MKPLWIKLISVDIAESHFALLITDKQESELYINILVGGKYLSYSYWKALSLAKVWQKTDRKEQILLICNRHHSNHKNLKIDDGCN